MTVSEADELIRRVCARPRKWRADPLGKLLRLTEAERRDLHIRTIGSVNMTKAERKQARKLRHRLQRASDAALEEQKPRDEYEANNSISRTKPWLALGISRRTWYRGSVGQVREQYTCS